MIDTYISASNEAAIRSFVGFFTQVIGPEKGRPAVPETVNEDGSINPAQPAAGDPSLWYACVRAPFAIEAMMGITIEDAAVGIAVVGVWA